ncbi:10121_t:CDS:2 [Diversispora eburnea]|uniref:10121_t:CDS:1 n=1 Tax=Diversispora eburnea TaxID=1213867 RepID=A0A9N8VCP9_9GLOM|nr:10121_t:CDS:2 [Diversispora eburnea]
MTINLPSDCLAHIFSYFEFDVKSLHSFLFVSRNWCLNVTPILWKRTFYITFRNSFSSRKRSKLISTYLLCLDWNWYSYQSLDEQRSINFDKKKYSDYDDYDECRKLYLTRELINHFIRRSITIDYLALTANDIEFIIPSGFCCFPLECWHHNNALKYIQTFIFNGNNTFNNKCYELYEALALCCKSIKFLSIQGGIGDNSNDSDVGESLANLIQNQRHLVKFSLWDVQQSNQLSSIIKAITLRKGKLKYLEFRFCNFSNCDLLFENLAKSCSELTTLKLIKCGDIQSNLNPITFSTPIFPDLNCLDLQGTRVPSKSLKTIFKGVNIDLRIVHVEGIEVGLRVIERIADYCPNITHLEAHVRKDKLLQLEILFRSCKNLSSLKFYEYISFGSVWQHLNVIKKYSWKKGLKIKKHYAGNYRELLMRELGHVIVEFE